MKPSLESILHEAVDFDAEAFNHALENGGIQITSGECPHCLIQIVTNRKRCLIRNVTDPVNESTSGSARSSLGANFDQCPHVLGLAALATSSVRHPVTKLREATRTGELIVMVFKRPAEEKLSCKHR